MSTKLSEHFSLEEMQCHCGCKLYIPNQELLDVLEDLRAFFGYPVIVTNSTRCEKHNKAVGGAEGSKHKLGEAADVQIKEVPPSDVQEYLLTRYPDKYGIGKYSNFTHIDVRKGKAARWG